MMFRKPQVFFSALLLFLTCTVVGQAQPRYHYIVPVMDQFGATAGVPIEIPVFLENHGTATVTLSLTLSENTSGYFSLDSLSQVFTLYPGEFAVAIVHFLSPSSGTFTTLLSVTDGTLNDTLLLTANVDAGPGPFVLLPPFQEVQAGLGQATQVPVTIQNLANTSLTVQISIAGDSEFSYTGAAGITIPAMGRETVMIDFLTSVEGRYSTTMTVTDGNYTETASIGVVAFDRPYTWILPFTDHVETQAGVEMKFPVMVQNIGNTAVSLQIALTGASAFTLDPAGQQITLQPGMGADIPVSVLSNTPGTYTAVLTVTDGSITDTLIITATILPGPGGFALMPERYDLRVQENHTATADFAVQSFSSSVLALDVLLVGDSHFSYSGPSPISIAPNNLEQLPIDFSAAAAGAYTAMLIVSDGTESDTALIVATVENGHTGRSLFTLRYDGMNGFMVFEAPLHAQLTKVVTIDNISSATLTLNVDVWSDSTFSIATNTLTIPSGASATLPVTFNNLHGTGEGMLIIDGGLQVEHIFLAGMELPYTDYNGLLVMNSLDFGMVDTATQVCLDVMLENTTSQNVTISSLALSGFSNAFTVMPPSLPIVISANSTAAIPVCFQPTIPNQVESEVLNVTFTNPASTPPTQTAMVNLTGRSTTGIRFPGDSCGIVGWYVNTIAAPIDGESDATIELFNITNQPLTLDNAAWEDGNTLGIYSLQTALPITIQPHNPAVPSSGKADITIRYAPTSQSSTVGVEDVATLRLESTATTPGAKMWLTLVGIPIRLAPSGSTIVLFPKNGRVSSIEMGNATLETRTELMFKNNLQVPVTVFGFTLGSEDRFSIDNSEDFPRTLAPDETLTLRLRSNTVPANRSLDVLTMQSSHEHLNNRFDLISGSGVTGIDDPPFTPAGIVATLSPNPSADRLHVSLNAPLENAHIEVLDMLGRTVAEYRGRVQNWTWDGQSNGIRAQAGAYRIRITGVTNTGEPVSMMKNAVLVR